MTRVLCETSNTSLASKAAKTIEEFHYEDACEPLRKALIHAPTSTAPTIAGTLAALNDKKAIPALRARLSSDRAVSSTNVVSIGKALYELQGDGANELIFECFRDAQSNPQKYWINYFFKEKNMQEARGVVQQVRETTTDEGVRKAADEFLGKVAENE